jgi:hypothetical protein
MHNRQVSMSEPQARQELIGEGIKPRHWTIYLEYPPPV